MGNANTSECDGNIDAAEREVKVDTSESAGNVNTAEREVNAGAAEREVNADTAEREVNVDTSESAEKVNTAELEVNSEVNANTPKCTGNANNAKRASNANPSESEADRAFYDMCSAYQHMNRLQKSNPQLSTYPNLEGLVPPMWLRIVGFTQKELSGIEKRTYRMACHYFALGHYVDMFNANAAKLKELGELEKRLNGRSKFDHIGPLCEYLPALPSLHMKPRTPEKRAVDEANLETGAKCSIHHPSTHCFLVHKAFLGKNGKCDLENIGVPCTGCEDGQEERPGAGRSTRPGQERKGKKAPPLSGLLPVDAIDRNNRLRACME